eukprot:SAG31_NODE_23540_length_502_cov_0.769231_1_plen_74_part_00
MTTAVGCMLAGTLQRGCADGAKALLHTGRRRRTQSGGAGLCRSGSGTIGAMIGASPEHLAAVVARAWLAEQLN